MNNAGVVDVKARVDEMSLARLERMFRINTIGSILCAREAVKRMSTKHGGKGGAIVNMTSAAAVIGGSGDYVDYAAAKGAIDSFTIGLAREVATEGIRVNAVRPGIIDTDIHASGGQPDRAEKMSVNVPVKRAGTADEVAQAVLWLLSDAASYSTGTIVSVDRRPLRLRTMILHGSREFFRCKCGRQAVATRQRDCLDQMPAGAR